MKNSINARFTFKKQNSLAKNPLKNTKILPIRVAMGPFGPIFGQNWSQRIQAGFWMGLGDQTHFLKFWNSARNYDPQFWGHARPKLIN